MDFNCWVFIQQKGLRAYLAQHKGVVNDIIQTEVSPDVANISFMINLSDLDSAKDAIKEIKKDIGINDVFIRDDIAEVSVVGVGMRTHYGVAEKMFGALAKAKVNIDTITTSEIRISCAVSKDQADKALEAVCLAFELDRPAKQRSKSS